MVPAGLSSVLRHPIGFVALAGIARMIQLVKAQENRANAVLHGRVLAANERAAGLGIMPNLFG